MLSRILAIVSASFLVAACGSTGASKPLVVSGKDYVYPVLSPTLLEPCAPPRIPVTLGVKEDVTTQRELLTYITNLITTIDKCNLKITTIKYVYTKFVKDTNALSVSQQPVSSSK